MTAASLIVRTNIDRKLGIVGLLTLLPVFNKSISVLVAPRLSRHCHRSGPHQTRMSIIYQSGPRCGGGGGADPGSRQIGLGNNNTHYNHGAPAVFPTSRESALQQVSEYYYRWIETLKILRHCPAFLRSRDQSLCCSCVWSRPLILTDADSGPLSLSEITRSMGRCWQLASCL